MATNPNIKITVVSEEPYWDMLWGGDFSVRSQSILIEGEEIKYTYLNHSTSNIFSFLKIPYFITTDNNFFSRYAMLFSRNSKLNRSEIESRWRQYEYHYAAMAQYRRGNEFDSVRESLDVYGLSDIRTRLTEALASDSSFVMGKGWPQSQVRQSLVDWHLDKLSCLDKKSRFISALENTHQVNYISEKIFDAFALLSVPIYFASDLHRIHELVPKSAFFNLYDQELDSAVMGIKRFNLNREFLDQYMHAQEQLKDIFCNTEHLDGERARVCNALIDEFKGLST
ncbi:glycosyltransferase family 10 [Neptunomonas sp. CHC150]|uniref:glycosyltransferase family 10 domain-containing protein n=1 Tax=Neptunomonas sp. CHC150 TaxID=2998324 RepID=UPI0025AFB31E|nr:glycosyltransferase family 10 [Neptunomonas sp. CHC150]MDN2661255.1 glycosyltransferase family 10 [Neptunomonas sp. CHC150]